MKLTQMTMAIREFDFTEEVKPVNMEITINPTLLSTVALWNYSQKCLLKQHN